MPRPHLKKESANLENHNDWSFEDIVRGNVNGKPTMLDEEQNGADNGSSWTLISAFDSVLENINMIGRNPEQWEDCISASQYLYATLNMSAIQIMVIAMLIDAGKPLSWGMMAKKLGISRLKMMTFTEEIEDLVTKHRWLFHKGACDMGTHYEGFALVSGVITAVRMNQIFKPEPLDNLTIQQFVDRLVSRLRVNLRDRDIKFSDEQNWMMELVKQNTHLPLCQNILLLSDDIHLRSLLLFAIFDYAQFGGLDDEGVDISDIDRFYPEDWQCGMLRQSLMSGENELMKKDYITFKCEDGMVDSGTFVLTDKSKNELLMHYRPYHLVKCGTAKVNDPNLIRYKNITAKQLFYNAAEEKSVNRLRQILSQEGFATIQDRLAVKGLRTGVAILLSGGPGTGKTETVKQLARETGRDLFMIDISSIKSKWVGDLEKNTQEIFNRYKTICSNCEVKPILFINECDAILGKRMENAERSVDKMQNAMQNILLQAIEDLEGIMICTTNLAQSLDSAFERRFLFNIKFNTPDAEVRSQIWRSMIPSLSDADAHILGERYNLSGGQCENVMRKAAIEEILNGTPPTLTLIDSFCKEEKGSVNVKKPKPVTGFSLYQNQ